jgi:hypothetical protein
MGLALNNYSQKKPKKARVIALCVKAVTGVLGGSLVLTNEYPYLTLGVLCLGAVVNEFINLYGWNNNEE